MTIHKKKHEKRTPITHKVDRFVKEFPSKLDNQIIKYITR